MVDEEEGNNVAGVVDVKVTGCGTGGFNLIAGFEAVMIVFDGGKEAMDVFSSKLREITLGEARTLFMILDGPGVLITAVGIMSEKDVGRSC